MKSIVIATLFALLAAVEVGHADCDLKSRGFAGFAFRDLTGADRDSLAKPDLEGIVVSVVVPGSPAEDAGMVSGDVLTGVDAHAVVDASGLMRVLASYYAEDSVVVSVLRGGEEIEIRPASTSDSSGPTS